MFITALSIPWNLNIISFSITSFIRTTFIIATFSTTELFFVHRVGHEKAGTLRDLFFIVYKSQFYKTIVLCLLRGEFSLLDPQMLLTNNAFEDQYSLQSQSNAVCLKAGQILLHLFYFSFLFQELKLLPLHTV